MQRMTKLIGLGTLCTMTAALAINCSSSGGGSSRALSTQEAALQTSETAMASLGNLASAAQVPLDTMRATQATSSYCDDNGTASHTGNDSIWGFTTFLCAGAHNTYSPDSALGAVSLMKGIICTADGQGLTYSASGSAVTFTNAPLTATCFPAEMLAAFASESPAITAVSGTATGFTMTSSGWDYRIEFRNMDPINDFDIYFRISGNVIAAAYKDLGGNDNWTVSLDQRSATSKIAYEAANNNRHMRLLGEGTITSAGVVSEVTSMAGILAESSGGQYVSLIGTGANGIKISWKKGMNSEITNQCLDIGQTGATCGSGAVELAFHTAQVTGFTDNSAITTAGGNFDNNPLSLSVGPLASPSFPVSNAPAGAFSSTLR